MNQASVDFAIFGSDPLAQLLAGSLASLHHKSVALISAEGSAFRLRHTVDLSVGPITRPALWALLAQTVPETHALVSRLGARRSLTRIDPIFFADSPAGKQALAHIRHMAQGFGHHVERTGAGALGLDREGIQVRDALWINRTVLEPMLPRWLERNRVLCFNGSDLQTLFNADGSVQMVQGQTITVAARAILADDAAISAYAVDHGPLIDRAGTCIMTEPADPLLAAVMVQIDAALVLTQGSSQAISGFTLGELVGAILYHM